MDLRTRGSPATHQEIEDELQEDVSSGPVALRGEVEVVWFAVGWP